MLFLAEGLRRYGWDTSAALPAGGPLIAHLDRAGIPWHDLPIERRLDARAGAIVSELVRRDRTSIVHVHTPKAGMLVRKAAKVAGAKVIMHVNGFGARGWLENVRLSPAEKVRKVALFALESYADRFTDMFILVNRHDMGRKVYPGGKQSLVYNGISIDDWPYSPPVPGHTILYPARISRQKDPATMLRAAAILLPDYPDLVLLMAGGGELSEEISLLSRNLGLENHVRFLGDRDDMLELYRSATVVVLATRWEGHPFATMEAMAVGRPVVATDCPGITETLRGCGVSVPKEDPAAIASAVKKYFDDPAECARTAEAARLIVADEFGAERMVERVARVYDALFQE